MQSPQPVQLAMFKTGSAGPPRRGLKPIAPAGHASAQDWQVIALWAKQSSPIAASRWLDAVGSVFRRPIKKSRRVEPWLSIMARL
jgi:hypothetical protein